MGYAGSFFRGFQEDGGNLGNFDQRNNSIVVPNALSKYLVSQNITASNVAFQQSFNACNLQVTNIGVYEICDGDPGRFAAKSAQHIQGQFSTKDRNRVSAVQGYKDSDPGGFRYLYNDQSRAAVVQ